MDKRGRYDQPAQVLAVIGYLLLTLAIITVGVIWLRYGTIKEPKP